MRIRNFFEATFTESPSDRGLIGDHMIELGKKIKMVREYNDLSQEELGAVVQKTKSTIGRYEKGLMEIPAKVIIDSCP